jgi:hypothetical protein
MRAPNIPISSRPSFVTLGPVLIVAVLSFSSAFMIVLYYSAANDGDRALIDFIAKAFFGAGGLVSMAVALQALHLNATRQRVTVAFAFLERYDCDDFISVRHFLDNPTPRSGIWSEFHLEKISPNQAEGFYISINQTPEMGAKIRSLLGFFEDMALGVATSHADEGTLHRSLRPSVIYFMSRLAPYIAYERLRTGDALYYEDALKLARAWSQDVSVISGHKMKGIWRENRS